MKKTDHNNYVNERVVTMQPNSPTTQDQSESGVTTTKSSKDNNNMMNNADGSNTVKSAIGTIATS